MYISTYVVDTPHIQIKKLVTAAIEEPDPSEARFKLRTASQLLDVVQEHTEDLSETPVYIQNSDLDDDLEKRLQDLGYIE